MHYSTPAILVGLAQNLYKKMTEKNYFFCHFY